MSYITHQFIMLVIFLSCVALAAALAGAALVWRAYQDAQRRAEDKAMLRHLQSYLQDG